MVKKILFVASIALAGAASAAQASVPADDRWLPWLGCWRAVDAPATNLLCILPDGDAVRLLELVNGAIVRESRTIADVQWRPVTQEGCTGNELARWSGDAERLYLISDMTCNRTSRKTTGVFAFVSPNEWVSVQSVSVSGLEPGTRTVRYVNADASAPGTMLSGLQSNRLARETSRYSMTKPLDLDDIREASSQVNAGTVEGLIVARKQPFDLNGKKLVELANAGVPESVIDVMVAVTHPGRFEVRNPSTEIDERRPNSRYGNRYCDEWDSWYDPGCGSSRYGYGYYNSFSPFGFYSPFGYGSWRNWNTPVIIVRGDDDEQQVQGRATRRGYTRGRSTSSDPSPSVGSSSSSGSSRSSGGSGGSSSGSGSSGSSTGRTAKPRGSN